MVGVSVIVREEIVRSKEEWFVAKGVSMMEERFEE